MIRVKQSFEWVDLSVFIYDRVTRQSAEKITFVKKEDGEPIQRVFGLDKNDAQTLMDDLWQCGVRPTDGAGTAGAMGAVQEHLKDLRNVMKKGGLME